MKFPRIITTLLAAVTLQSALATEPLSLDEAVERALAADDPQRMRFEARAEALSNDAVADAQLPDPMLTGQIANLPTDSFRFDRDGMTQALRLGLRQEFPAGRSRQLAGRQKDRQAEAADARAELAARDIALEVRQQWLELALHERASEVLQRSRATVAEQIESLTARFATGRMHAQDMLRAELELALIDDQRTEHQRQADLARAALARYLGTQAYRPLPASLPDLPAPGSVAALETRLTAHPSVAAQDAEMEAAEVGVDLAEQAYKPKFALEGGYGFRADRADLASIGLTLSLPLFTDKRQDRRRSAALERSHAETLERDLLLRDLRRRLEQELANWQRLDERLVLYTGAVGERARQTAEAAVTTYANGQTDFAEMIRARIAELQIEVKRIELETRRAQAWARIAWLTGADT
jgi:outer membrane protein TolC